MNLKNNKHLKEVEKILDDWDENKGYLVTNDIQGVDLISEINIKKLGLDIEDEDEIAEMLEAHYDGSDYFFRYSKDDYCKFALVVSSCEEIFITFEGDLCFPDKESKSVKLSKDNREIEIMAYALEWMHDNGCFPSIYELDYYGYSPTLYNFYDTEEYKKLSSDDKKQKEEVDRLVEIIEFQKQLDETTLNLGDLPSKFYEALPKLLQTNDGYIEVLSVDSFDAYTLTFEFDLEDLEDDALEEIEKLIEKKVILSGIFQEGSYKITVSLLPNSVRFITGLDDKISLVTKESI